MEKIARLRELSGAKALLALKCFATWGVFDFMAEYMDGTTSSSLNEVRLGRERFGKETHAYSVAYADHEIDEVVSHADKIIFNSISQLTRFSRSVVRHHPRPAAQSRRLVLVLRSRRSGAAVLAAGRMGSEKGRAGDGDDLRLHDPQQLRKRRIRPV
jgi:diaminopimelate decarboxylase